MDKQPEGHGPQSGAYGGAKISPKDIAAFGKGSAHGSVTFPSIFGKVEGGGEVMPGGSQAHPGGSNPQGSGTQGGITPMEESTLGSSLGEEIRLLFPEETPTVSSETGRSETGDTTMEVKLSKREKNKRKREEKKRRRKEQQERSFTEREAKRPKAEAKGLQVAVLREDGEKMTEDEAEYVRDILLDYAMRGRGIRKGTPEENIFLRFEKSGLVEEGMFLITCADEVTFSYIKEKLQIPEWEGKTFTVVAGEDIPKMERVIGYFPGKRVVKMPNSEILRKFTDQNPELIEEVPRWRVIGRYQMGEGRGLKLVILVPSKTMEILEHYEWRPYFEITRVNFRRPGEKKEDQS